MQYKMFIAVVVSLTILFLLGALSSSGSQAAEPSQNEAAFNFIPGRIQIAQSAPSSSMPPTPEKPPSTTGTQGRSTGLCSSPDGRPIPCEDSSPRPSYGVRTRGFISDPLAERERALQVRKKMLLRSLSEVETELQQLQKLRKGNPSPPNPPR